MFDDGESFEFTMHFNVETATSTRKITGMHSIIRPLQRLL